MPVHIYTMEAIIAYYRQKIYIRFTFHRCGFELPTEVYTTQRSNLAKAIFILVSVTFY